MLYCREFKSSIIYVINVAVASLKTPQKTRCAALKAVWTFPQCGPITELEADGSNETLQDPETANCDSYSRLEQVLRSGISGLQASLGRASRTADLGVDVGI